jgi:hypothetical protein
MKLDYAPFYFAEWDGQIFHSAEELERYQKKERTEFWQKKNCLERMQYTGLLVVYGVWFFFLCVKAKLFGQ